LQEQLSIIFSNNLLLPVLTKSSQGSTSQAFDQLQEQLSIIFSNYLLLPVLTKSSQGSLQVKH
jgi:hypothetical protein